MFVDDENSTLAVFYDYNTIRQIQYKYQDQPHAVVMPGHVHHTCEYNMLGQDVHHTCEYSMLHPELNISPRL